jgi:5-methylcytosine-specific restriction endonuclease McrA
MARPSRQPAKLTMLAPRFGTLDTRTARPAPKAAAPIYTSPEWRALMARLLRERGRRCENPACGRTGTRIFGDHIRELQDGGAPFDERNVQLLCGSCHTAKTARARAARTKAQHLPPP